MQATSVRQHIMRIRQMIRKRNLVEARRLLDQLEEGGTAGLEDRELSSLHHVTGQIAEAEGDRSGAFLHYQFSLIYTDHPLARRSLQALRRDWTQFDEAVDWPHAGRG